MAALVLPVLGQAVGSALLPGSLGFLGLTGGSVGWLAGSLLASSFQTQKTQGPRLADLRVSGSAYGSPIPYLLGRMRMGGQVIWASSKREISTTTSRRAKGGPKVTNTSYTYEVDLLMKFTCNRVDGVSRLFINGELQWTSANDTDFGSINASNLLARRITIYRGDDDQLPDPTYEAAVGAGAPAYIDSCTIFFEGLQLGTNGQIPNIEADVAQRASNAVRTQDLFVTEESDFLAYGFSDGQKTFFANEPAAGGFSATYEARYVNAQGQVFDASTFSLSNFGFGMIGRSDRPVFVYAGVNLSNKVYARFADADVTLDFDATGIGFCYAIKGEDLVVYTGSGNLYRYTPVVTGGSSPKASASGVTAIRSIAIVDSSVYAFRAYPGGLGTETRTIDVYDLDTLALVDSITTPEIYSSAEVMEDDSGNLMVLDQAALYRWNGTGWDTALVVPLGYGAYQSTGNPRVGANPYYIDGSLYTSRGNTSGVDPRVRVAWPTVDPSSVPLDEAIEELSERAGLDLAYLDASALSSQYVRGYAITPTTTRAALDVLSQVFHFECSPGEQLVMVPIGGNVVATIPFEDLGTAEYGNTVENALPLVSRNDAEVPGFVTVKYLNASKDGQDGAVRSARIATDSNAEQFVEFSILMTPSEAKTVADFLANLLQASRLNVSEIALQTKWTRLMPCDTVLLTDKDGSTYRVRLQQRDDVAGIIRFTAVFDNQSATDSDGVTDDNFENTSTIRGPAPTDWVYGDWPLFRDADDNIGVYWAAAPLGDFWPGAVLLESSDDVVYESVSQIEEAGVVGTATTALGDYTGYPIPDEGNGVTVSVGVATLASITYDEQIALADNIFMIGDECVVARVATYVSAGTYRLSGLLRGLFGTEWAKSSHAVGERVVKIQTDGIRRVVQDLTDLDTPFYYRAPTFGQPLDSAVSRVRVNTGVSAKPYAPTNLWAERDMSGTGTTTAHWNRRTRLSERWWLGVVPLGEESEVWHVYSYTDNTYTVLAEPMITTTTNEYEFADDGPKYLRIAQVSARVGEGYFLQGAI